MKKLIIIITAIYLVTTGCGPHKIELSGEATIKLKLECEKVGAFLASQCAEKFTDEKEITDCIAKKIGSFKTDVK